MQSAPRDPIASSGPAERPVEYAPPKVVHSTLSGVNVKSRQALAGLGAALLLIALPAGLLTPGLPLGLVLAVLGAMLLSLHWVWARRWLDEAVLRHPTIEAVMPASLVRALLGRDKRVKSAP